jgi:hypothetical protein
MMLVKLGTLIFSEDVIINAVDPGLCKGTGLHRDIHGGKLAVLVIAKTIFGRSPEAGALAELDAAIINSRRAMIAMLKIGKSTRTYFRVLSCNSLRRWLTEHVAVC